VLTYFWMTLLSLAVFGYYYNKHKLQGQGDEACQAKTRSRDGSLGWHWPISVANLKELASALGKRLTP
jgi:hypothetical protein